MVMTERTPSEDPNELLFPHLYDASDRVANDVGSQPVPPRKSAAGRRAERHSVKFSAVARVAIDRVLRDHALKVAEGDARRLVLRSEGSVIVANNHEQAKRALRDQTFGAVEASDTATRLDDYVS